MPCCFLLFCFFPFLISHNAQLLPQRVLGALFSALLYVFPDQNARSDGYKNGWIGTGFAKTDETWICFTLKWNWNRAQFWRIIKHSVMKVGEGSEPDLNYLNKQPWQNVLLRTNSSLQQLRMQFLPSPAVISQALHGLLRVETLVTKRTLFTQGKCSPQHWYKSLNSEGPTITNLLLVILLY